MRYKVKKLFNGFASIRDYIIKKCVDSENDLIIEFEDKKMTVPLSKLDNPFQLHEREFVSKYDGSKYKLYDFKFIPSDDKQEEMKL
jgi:hypothetical protein|tara:strand:- start:84 stop:341 length:258 start_codon:yes stop_codon:yes gene_type:complete